MLLVVVLCGVTKGGDQHFTADLSYVRSQKVTRRHRCAACAAFVLANGTHHGVEVHRSPNRCRSTGALRGPSHCVVSLGPTTPRSGLRAS